MEDLDVMYSPRSTFVTVLAWLFIVLAGFATVIGILQNIMITVMFHEDEFARSMEQSKNVDKMPFFFKSFMAHPQYLFLAILVVFAVVFIVSIGLLKRKNWARLLFIAIMGLGIAWNAFAIFMQFSMFSSFPSPANDHFASGFKTMTIVMQIFLIILAIGLSVLFGWIIRKLASERIRNEFIVKR
jgi:hypothetical protein